MKTLLTLAALSFLTACGSDRKDPSPPPQQSSQRLQEQIDRIAPQLLYCDGIATEAGFNNVSGRPDCNSGDSILWSSLFISGKRNASVEEAIRDSIDPSGRPFRSPEHRRSQEHQDSFSRDHYIGLLLYSVVTKDVNTIKRVYAYAALNGYNLCPSDSDSRCFLTPNMIAITSDVFRYLNIPRTPEMTFNRAQDEELNKFEASRNDGYALHLVAVKAYIRIKTGHLTESYAKTLKIIHNRKPDNPFYGYLSNLANGGSDQEYRIIEEALLKEMQVWTQGSRREWSFQRHDWSGTVKDSMGHELVMLAYILMGEQNARIP